MKKKLPIIVCIVFLSLFNFHESEDDKSNLIPVKAQDNFSEAQAIDQKNVDDYISQFPATCFAPDTDPKIIEEFYKNRNVRANSLGLSQDDFSSRFNLTSRWLSTALDGGGLTQGDKTTLTWSYVPDGTPIGGFNGNIGCGVPGESTDPSNFIAFFNGIYGPPTTPGDFTTAPWHQVFIDMFDSWSAVSGLIFVYEPNDDGATVVTGGPGISGTRADLRISGHPLDGNSGVLACNYFPQNGDMIIDTSDNFFPNNPGLGTTNVLTHEVGHGLGILHVCPVEETKLMEPFVSFAFQGPQEDDILATNRSYGDPEGANDTPATASVLGANPNPTTYSKLQRSVDDNSDVDYYSFTVSETSTLTAALTPTGTTYLDGVQNPDGSCSPGTNFNALTVSDLKIDVLDTDGSSVIETADSNGPGVAENLLVTLSAPGTYFVRVEQQGTAVDNVQIYDLQLNLEAGSCTTANIPTNVQASSITDSSAQISWDAQSSVLYDLRYRESGTIPWIDITDLVASNTTLAGLVELTEYEVQVRSKCLGDTPTAYSPSIFFTTLETLLVYCDAGPISSIDSEIENVTLLGESTSINNDTTNICTGSAGGEISDFTNLSADLIAGSNYTLSVEFGDCDDGFQYDGAGGVWIDWNLDGDFEDPNEEIGTTTVAVSTGNVVVDYTVAVPLGQNVGNYRMRIVQEEGATSADVSPCGTFIWGAVEDYTIVIDDPCTVFEDFEAGLPAGWSTVVNTGSCDWNNQSFTPTGSDFPTLAMVFDDDACGLSAPASNVSLLSDVYDTTGAASILIGYDVAFQEVGLGETLSVEVWDGAVWQQIAFYDTDLFPNIQTERNIDATAFANADFQVRWTYDDANKWGWHAGVDNFCLSLSNNNWEGTISSDWNTPGNWSLGAIPTATDTALILDAPNQPVIDAVTTAEVDNLILNSNTEVSVEGILNVAGDIDNEGTIIFRSDASGSGQFDEFTGTISGTGEVTAERYIPAGLPELRRAYRFLTSSVNSTGSINANWQEGVNNSGTNFPTDNQNPNPGFGIHITGGDASLGFDQTGSNNPSMFTFDNSETGPQENAWTPVPNTNTKTLKAGEGYLTFVRGDRSINVTSNSTEPTNTTLRATGELHTGPREFSSANNATLLEYGLNDQAGLFSFVGNPYQSIVDINDLDFSNINTMFYWVWDPNLGTRGNYTTVTLPGGSNNTSSPANQFIQPGQSFFVQTVANGPASLTFNEDDKDVNGTATGIFSEQDNPSIKMLLYSTDALNNDERESDGLMINLAENANNALDIFDADKLTGPDENLARLQDNKLISIEQRDLPTATETLALSTSGYTTDNYSFVIYSTNIQGNFEAYLLDDYTGTQTQLNEGETQIDFTIDAGIPASIDQERFKLVFETETFSTTDNTFGADFSLYPNPSKGQFSIKTVGLTGNNVELKIYNILGQQVFSQIQTIENNGEVNVDASGLSSGLYLIELQQDEQVFSTKLIIE